MKMKVINYPTNITETIKTTDEHINLRNSNKNSHRIREVRMIGETQKTETESKLEITSFTDLPLNTHCIVYCWPVSNVAVLTG